MNIIKRLTLAAAVIAMNRLIDGKVVRVATGPNSEPAEHRIKQYESFLTMLRSVVEYSLDAGKSWVILVGNERRDLLEKAEKKQPICFQWADAGDLVMVFLAWPFAEAPEWIVKLKIALGQERDVKMHRQWPMLRVFSKSNPGYGL